MKTIGSAQFKTSTIVLTTIHSRNEASYGFKEFSCTYLHATKDLNGIKDLSGTNDAHNNEPW